MNVYYGKMSKKKPEFEKRHFEMAREIAARGIVLLENDGLLPLAGGTRVALYGYGARNTVFCGLGSASINCREYVNIETGLEEDGLIVTSKEYLDRYDGEMKAEEEEYYKKLRDYCGENLYAGVVKMYGEPFVPACQTPITEEDVKKADADIAVYVISRNSGEGADRRYTEGDYLLSEAEKKNLQFLSEKFRYLIVLLNVGGVIDTSEIRSLKHLSALLMMGQAGGVTGLAAADVLTGRVNPEGKLTTTWAEKYEDYPNAANFAAMNGNLDDEMYTEGIYVGYRYFDAFHKRPSYPFGFGRSYTEFKIQTEAVRYEEQKVVLSVSVKNTGKKYSGRETVQVYVSPPGGKLFKAVRSLAGFRKTQLLAPGEKEELEVAMDIKNFSSYSEEEAAWLLEKGDYQISLGNSSRNTVPAAVLEAGEKIYVEKCRNLFALDCELEEMQPVHRESGSAENRQEALTAKRPDILPENLPMLQLCQDDVNITVHKYRDENVSGHDKSCCMEKETGDHCTDGKKGACYRLEDVVSGRISLDTFVDSLTEEEMVLLCIGNPGEDSQAAASIVAAGTGASSDQDSTLVSIVPGASDSTRKLIKTRGIPNVQMADGESGVRLAPVYEVDHDGLLLTSGLLSIHNVEKILGEENLIRNPENNIYYQYATGLPIGTLLAQTWDPDLCRVCGEIIGRELQEFHVEFLLAPSMNIHRNPLGGRNFEYFSEDPLIVGECGASMVLGIQSFRRTAATIKHLACNNQEDNRGATSAHVSERALREIYLRGYEIAVKKAHPLAMMTSLNLINGVHAANNYDLLTAAARDEWGFQGLVMTDWGTTSQSGNSTHKYKASTCSGCILAGNDLIMPGSFEDLHNLEFAVKNGAVSREDLKVCVTNILNVILAVL